MPSVKISLFDDEDPKQWKAFEDAMARAFLRALRVASKEHTVAGHTPPEPEASAAGPPQQRQPEFGALLRGGNAGQSEDEHEGDEATPTRRRRRQWSDVCREVFTLPDGFIPIENAREAVGGNEAVALNLIRDWVFEGSVEGVIWSTRRMTPTFGLRGHLMINQSQLAGRIQERRHRHLDGEMSTGMPTGIPPTSH